MKCPVCNKEVTELEEVCPRCGTNFDEYEKKHIVKKEVDDSDKSVLIKVINIFQLTGFIMLTIIKWSETGNIQSLVYLVVGIVVFAFIKGFTDIIDLLESINNKLN